MRIPRLSLIACLLGGAACEADVGAARPQWIVTVSTDAPVPQFGDRLLVEIVDESGVACSGCRRLFDGGAIDTWPLSFGVVPNDNAVRIRARLFRAGTIDLAGDPPAGTTIDALVDLGEPGEVGVLLGMSCFGVDADVATGTACDPGDGSSKPASEIAVDRDALEVGSWPPSVRTPCAQPSDTTTVCVEGGAMLLGNAAAVPLEEEGEASRPERIVILPPYRLDVRELTVGDFLDLRLAHPELEEPADPTSAGIEDGEHCTYRGASDVSTRDYPLNCIDHALATAICAARSMRLPTEAEWEFAAGNTVRESTYPWGEDTDICSHSVVARKAFFPAQCLAVDGPTLAPGPVPSIGTDVTDLGLLDLGGNVSEWVADRFSAYGQTCWAPLTLVDPLCTEGGSASVRGGNWAREPASAVGVKRNGTSLSERSPQIGLRCAADG